MKKVIYSLCLLVALTAMSVNVSAQQAKSARNDQFGLLNHVAVGVDLISPDGFGIGVGTSLFPWLQVRASYSIVPWSVTKMPWTIDGVGTKGQPIAWDVKMDNRNIHLEMGAFMTRHTGSLMFDFFPSRKSSFHLTVGMLAGTPDILTLKNTNPLNNFEGAGITFYPGGDNTPTNLQRINITNGVFQVSLGRSWAVRPYVGLGWGSFVPSKRVGVMFDMGVEYTGGMGLFVNAKNIHGEYHRLKLDGPGLVNAIENATGNPADASVNQISNIYKTVSSIPVAGYIKLAVVVKIF